MKIKVPEGMLEAFHKAENHHGFKWDDVVLDKMLEAALRWLSENPVVPTEEQLDDLIKGFTEELDTMQPNEAVPSPSAWCAVEWQRRMFFSEEEDLPAQVKEAIYRHFGANPADWVKDLARDAYRLGQQHPKSGN